MPAAKNHPHYLIEKEHLEKALSALDAYIRRHTPTLGHAADQKTAHAVYENQKNLLQEAKDARKKPYFGRVDWQRDANGQETFYVGNASFQDPETGCEIYAWQDTLVGDLYYQMRTDREEGTLLLKRTLGIEHDILKSIADEHVAEALRDELTADRGDEMLLEILKGSRGRRLRDIVATIQQQQHRIITAPEDQILVVQGPPGSGKTEIALHRVSYLLYQHRQARRGGTKRILVLGPSRLFTEYTANVLVALGERQVQQLAFDEWMADMLAADIDYEPQHASLEVLLDQNVDFTTKIMRYRNARNKGSLDMAGLLDAYVTHLQQEAIVGRGDLVCQTFTLRGEAVTETRTQAQLRELLQQDQLARLPFNGRRAGLEARLVSGIVRKLTGKINKRSGPLSDRMRDRLRETITEQVHDYFEGWNSQNVSVAYRRLLRNPQILFKVGQDIFSSWDLELMAQDAPTSQTPFRFSDLAALMYLKMQLDGEPEEKFDHIMIDEAQDITPLLLRVIMAFSRQGYMTILGDLGQGIFAHHGVSAWSALLPDQAFTEEKIPRSYRSTQQIIAYANRLLAQIDTRDPQPVDPIARPGPEPGEQVYQNRAQWAAGVSNIIADGRKNGWASFAILAKSLDACRTLHAALQETRLTDMQLIQDEHTAQTKDVVVMPVHLAKGLEFDVVVVADADTETYPVDQLHARLLYVAATRASHELFITWLGERSALLQTADTPAPASALLAKSRQDEPVTVTEYAAAYPQVSATWCVERLAGADKFGLFQQGRIDRAVLDVILKPYMQNLRLAGEVTVTALSVALREKIRQQVKMATANPDAQGGLSLTQLAYGLARNHLRFAGLKLDDADETALVEQIIVLNTYFQAVSESPHIVTTGRWTTERAVLEKVVPQRQVEAGGMLAILIDYGLVETGEQQLRMRSEWLPGLISLALGVIPNDWDADLLSVLPRPPLLLPRQEMAMEVSAHG